MDADLSTVVKIENCESDENEILRAHIKEESANANEDDTGVCIKTEVDDFMIYEINEVDSQILFKNSKRGVEPTGRFPRTRPKISDISQRSFRLNNGPILKKKEQLTQQAAPPNINSPRLIRIPSSKRSDNLTSTNDFHYNNSHMTSQELTYLPSRQISSKSQCATTMKQVNSSGKIDRSATTVKPTSFQQKFPKIKEFWEMLDTVTTKVPRNPENLVLTRRKISPTKVCSKPDKKPLVSYRKLDTKCDCHLYPMKDADVYTKLGLKDFFEQMFEKTRKLSFERRQMIKMEFLKTVCRAEEDVEDGKFCEMCYTTILARN